MKYFVAALLIVSALTLQVPGIDVSEWQGDIDWQT